MAGVAMRYGSLPGLSKPVSRLVMGTMVCQTDQMQLSRDLLDEWLEVGGNCIDTANVYGTSERAIGQWLAERGVRERVIILTKGAHPNSQGARVNRQGIDEDIAESQRRLGVEHLDIYLLHRDDPATPVGELVDCLNAHKETGDINLFGGSNWTTARIQEANEYAAAHGLQPFSLNSPYFGLAAQKEPMWGGCLALTDEARQWHIERQFPLFPWSSQAGGFFTGRYSPDDHSNADVVRVYYNDANWERYRRAELLARDKSTTANNIALSYVLDQPFPVFPLIGPRTLPELHASLASLEILLSEGERQWLNLERDDYEG